MLKNSRQDNFYSIGLIWLSFIFNTVADKNSVILFEIKLCKKSSTLLNKPLWNTQPPTMGLIILKILFLLILTEEEHAHGFIKVVLNSVIFKLFLDLIRCVQKCWRLISTELGAKIYLALEHGLISREWMYNLVALILKLIIL